MLRLSLAVQASRSSGEGPSRSIECISCATVLLEFISNARLHSIIAAH